MLRFNIDNFLRVVTFLHLVNGLEQNPELATDVVNLLAPLNAACFDLKLSTTRQHINEILEGTRNFDETDPEFGRKTGRFLQDEAPRLAQTLRRELSTKSFLALPDETSIELFENERPFDHAARNIKVNERFPQAIYDIQESANCRALSRPTACVFHLMRVLEVGLNALATELGIPWPSRNDWQDVINAIEGKIKEIEKGSGQLPSDWREKRQFYADAATQFTHFKDGWRNYAMHFHAVYDEGKAEIIFASVREFMRVLATRLSSV